MLKKVNISELFEIIEKNKIENDDIFDRIVLEKILQKWKDIVGPILEKNVYPEKYSRKKLTIVSSHPAYKHEVSFLNEKIINEINSLFNQTVLEKIIFNTSFIGLKYKHQIKKEKPVNKTVK
ncbi:MAG: DUF721 domain-containing protein [Leptospiraceae bacterium]|nr:DUF721 domain-containing protein [Leptospiraceae bacterium]